MRFVFVRHGERERLKTGNNGKAIPDSKQGLSGKGEQEVEKLKRLLTLKGIRPNRCFSSEYCHALDTARLLVAPQAVKVLKCLTPEKENKEGWDEFVEQSAADSFAEADVILVVGHEPRLGYLISSMISRRIPPLTRGGAVCIKLDSRDQLTYGMASTEWRWPITGGSGAELKDKLTAKMTVSATLAGLALTSVSVLLGGGKVSSWRAIGLFLLTAAIGLFVASLYAYDRLMMPEVFWSAAEGGRSLKPFGLRSFRNDRNKNGLLYAEMVWTWKYVFSPGLFLASLGYLSVLGDIEGDITNWACSRLAAPLCTHAPHLIGALILILASAYYFITRPRLGVD